MPDTDERVRLAAFEFLDQQTKLHGGSALPYGVLLTGFLFEGTHLPWVRNYHACTSPSTTRWT